VLGLHVIDIVSDRRLLPARHLGSLGFEPYLDFSAKMREALRERGRVLWTRHAALRGTERSLRHEPRMGSSPTRSATRPRNHDLVVMGHRGVNEQFSTGLLGSTTSR